MRKRKLILVKSFSNL